MSSKENKIFDFVQIDRIKQDKSKIFLNYQNEKIESYLNRENSNLYFNYLKQNILFNFNFNNSFFKTLRLQDFVSGVSGGVLSTVILHPLDVLKTRLAVNDGQSSTKPTYYGLRNAARTIFVQEGVSGFYRGFAPNCLGAGFSWGFYFVFYNSIKNKMISEANKDLRFDQHMVAAAEAGVLTLILTNPIWVIKTRLCLQYGSNSLNKLPEHKQYKGINDAFNKIYKNEGIKGLYKGFVPGMFGVSHGAIQFMVYEELKKIYKNKHNLKSNLDINLYNIFYFSVISKLCAATLTYPFQVVRARLQDQHSEYKSFMDTVLKTLRREGFNGFYKGFLPNSIRYVSASCITLVTYEFLAKYKKN